MTTIYPSPDALAFFGVEIRNERHGGISPATIDSAIDSFVQAPEDIQSEWANEAESSEGNDPAEFLTHLEALRAQDGPDAELQDYLFAADRATLGDA